MTKDSRTLVFSHIEKCAGTSLTSFFRQHFPFESCDILASGNKLSNREVAVAKLLYPNCRFLAGHSVTPASYAQLREKFGDIVTFTVLREPIERLISNYAFDKARGVWSGGLLDYAKIEWKTNYLLRFLGDGNVDKGEKNTALLDFAITVKSLGELMPLVMSAAGVGVEYQSKKVNTVARDWGGVPDDIAIENGVPVGTYKIMEEEYRIIEKLNQKDVEFYKTREEIANSLIKNKELTLARKKKVLKPLVQAAHVYRNAVYKPIATKKLGYHALPRNSKDPSMVEAKNAFC